MSWATALAGLLLTLVLGEVRRETWDNGTPRAEYEVEQKGGREVKSGPYRAWHENGQPASEGAFSDDREVGRWKFFHPSGQPAATGSFARGERTGTWETFHASGAKESKGRYEKGKRVEQWKFWLESGADDEARSGLYEPVELRLADGRALSGERLELRLHGEWRGTWPDGAPLFTGSFVRGRREGPWLFFTPDGAPSASLSHQFAANHAAGPAVLPGPAGAGAPMPIAAGRLGAPSDAAELEAELDAWLAAKSRAEEQLLERKARWPTAGAAALPVALKKLVAQDPESEAGRVALGRIEAGVLRKLCHGHALFPTSAPPATPDAARELQRAWAALWAATADDVWFWRVELPLIPADGSEELVLADRPVRSLLAALGESAPPALYARRFAPLDAKLQAPLTAALDWLEAHQLPDGHWSANIDLDEERESYDPGATGLALLALLGGGRGPSTPAVARGIGWLLANQSSATGEIPAAKETSDWLYMHLLATLALSEAQALRPSPFVKDRIALALEVVFAAQNPDSGWRYDLPPTGESDTSVTAWAVAVLFAARAAGIEADYEPAFEGARKWIEKVTEPNKGRIGYSALDELSSRTPVNEHFPREKGEAQTAAGLFARRLLGVPSSDPMAKKQLALLETRPPLWDPDGLAVDEYYFFYGAHAFALCSPKPSVAWTKGLAEIAHAQSADKDERGSWPPVGVWSYCGGRVYSTAMLALALEAQTRLTLPEENPKDKKKRK